MLFYFLIIAASLVGIYVLGVIVFFACYFIKGGSTQDRYFLLVLIEGLLWFYWLALEIFDYE